MTNVVQTDPSAALAANSLVNAFTVDVEDCFQVSAFEKDIDRSSWDSYEHRVGDNTTRMLELLARHEVAGTFFVLGWTARRSPNFVKRIDAAGHETLWHAGCGTYPAYSPYTIRRYQ